MRQTMEDGSNPFLTPAQRHVLRDKLRGQQNLSFSAMLKLKVAGQPVFPGVTEFNLAAGNNDKVAGFTTTIALQKVLGEDGLARLSSTQLDEIVTALIEAEDDQAAREQLDGFSIPADRVEALLGLAFSSGTMNLSTKAMTALTPLLEGGMNYADAVASLTDDDGKPLHHSQVFGQRLPAGTPLPYYGAVLVSSVIGGDPEKYDAKAQPERHFGKISNPTVHVALNQLRALVNTLIREHGHPAEVHIELTRELNKGAVERKKISKQQKANRQENERLRTLAATLGVEHPSRTDLHKLKLWEALNHDDPSDRRCVYTGQRIAAS